jgi:ferredoxin
MAAKINNVECTGCGICVDECPATAIELKNEKATIDEGECTDCGTCIDSCPNTAISSE